MFSTSNSTRPGVILAAALVAALAAAGAASRAGAVEIERIASEDSFLRVSRPNSNEGANEVLSLQGSGVNRAVVGFDLAGITPSHVTSARLVLTVGRNFRGWGSTGRAVDVHPLLAGFAEGNGRTYRVGRGKTRGSGPGVTWACASDAGIGNASADCAPTWDGGLFGPASDSVVHGNATTGEVRFDVTADVVAGRFAWIVKRNNERAPGRIQYVSREGAAAAGDPRLAPRLEIVACSPTPEVCNGRDDDCDGAIDDDVPVETITCGVGACERSVPVTCVGGQPVGTCEPGEPADESCNAVDDDCDGAIDDGIAPVPTSCGVGACARTGTQTCADGALVDSCEPGTETTESCYDGADNDCDGTVDEQCASCASVGGTTTDFFAGCWYLGDFGQSCNAVCSAHGLVYSDLTRGVVGSDGSPAWCIIALTRLGAHDQERCDGTTFDTFRESAGPAGLGCIVEDWLRFDANRCSSSTRVRWEWARFVFPATTASASAGDVQRVCACRS